MLTLMFGALSRVDKQVVKPSLATICNGDCSSWINEMHIRKIEQIVCNQTFCCLTLCLDQLPITMVSHFSQSVTLVAPEVW